MGGDTNGAPAPQGTPPPMQKILIESDGVTMRIQATVPPDLAEAMLYRALQHFGRQLLIAQLQSAKPKVELFPSAQGFTPRGLV